MTRYARQIILPEVGTDGQKKLSEAHVLVVGAGGLGCPVLQYLVGAGIGKITLVDDDVVDQSNLHRQTLYNHDCIGTPKAQAAAQILARLNPDCKITPVISQLTPR
ncbi:MAG: thiamine biosynthesis protein ThiF, partial [Rhodobacteraceae bacterium]